MWITSQFMPPISQIISVFQLSINLELKSIGLQSILHLAHALEFVHAIYPAIIPALEGFCFQPVDPEFYAGYSLLHFRKAPYVVKMSMGHYNALYSFKLNTHLLDRLNLITSFTG